MKENAIDDLAYDYDEIESYLSNIIQNGIYTSSITDYVFKDIHLLILPDDYFQKPV